MRKKTPFSLFQAGLNDVDEIETFIFEKYFPESGFRDLSYDRDRAKDFVTGWIKEGIVIIVRSSGQLIGFAGVAFVNTFYKQKEADIHIFFVHPEFRATGVSRAIADTINRLCDLNGASISYTSCVSEIGKSNNNLYVNLWKKFGFSHAGSVMIRS